MTHPSRAQVPIPGADSPPKLGEPFEAVLYIHGFASSLHESTLPFGQLLALAALPGHIKPFIFSWPCGHYLTYFQAKRMAKSKESAQVSPGIRFTFVLFVLSSPFVTHVRADLLLFFENQCAPAGFGRRNEVP